MLKNPLTDLGVRPEVAVAHRPENHQRDEQQNSNEVDPFPGGDARRFLSVVGSLCGVAIHCQYSTRWKAPEEVYSDALRNSSMGLRPE